MVPRKEVYTPTQEEGGPDPESFPTKRTTTVEITGREEIYEDGYAKQTEITTNKGEP